MNNKKAYPNVIDNYLIKRPHNITKWMEAFQDIYEKVNSGLSRSYAFNLTTSGWDKMEKRDFENWLKFYEGNNHVKYKTAQMSYYVNDGMPGYIIPFKKNEIKEEVKKEPEEVFDAIDAEAERQAEIEKRQLIEKQRSKFLSRLNSAEKLLTEDAGHLLAGDELSRFLEILHSLKREILSLNKKTSSNKTYIDLIIRKANILHRDGFVKSASLIEKLAQATATPAPTPPTPGPSDPNEQPLEGSIAEGNPQADHPLLEPPVDGALPGPIEDGKPNKIDGFLQNLNPVDKAENFSAEDGEIEIEDDELLEIEDEYDDSLISTAQVVAKPNPEDLIEVADEEPKVIKQPEVEKKEEGQDFDYLVDVAFKNLKIEDVIRKLEEIAKIFKNREISRQLSIVDLMLDRLSISTFFPSLSEAQNKSLESNQYCLTRIEDILSSLRGAVESQGIDLISEDNNISDDPKIELIKQKLERDRQKEKERKELRKSIEEKELENKKEVPVIEDVTEELGEALPTITPVNQNVQQQAIPKQKFK